MMDWITPLGFLGFLGILALILIYLLKPNYQQKIVSSTYVWKLSLKYRKKRIPISRVRNLLIFICQVLIISSCALMLAQPIIAAEVEPEQTEKIIILESSANMLSVYDTETRFERAVTQAKDVVTEAINANGLVTIIMADEDPHFITERSDNSADMYKKLDELVVPNKLACSYGIADIDGAMALATQILDVSPNAETILFTATEYLAKGDVTVKNVAVPAEWNAAILNCTATVDENYYTFTVEVAVYNRDYDLQLYCDVYGVNDIRQGQDNKVSMRTYVRCENNETITYTFDKSEMGNNRVFAFNYAHFYINESDSFGYDNNFYVYGGRRPELKIQYASSAPNPFVSTTLKTIQSLLRDKWDINIVEVRRNIVAQTEGFNVYVYEHSMPKELPTDGFCILLNPDVVPDGVDIVMGDEVSLNESIPLSEGETFSELMQYVNPADITVWEWKRINTYNGYKALMYCGGDPVYLVNAEKQIAILPFSVHDSNMPIRTELTILFRNIFEYFIPATVMDFVYDVNETVSFNARSGELTISGGGMIDETFTTFPNTISFAVPGVYDFRQMLKTRVEVIEQIFVKVPQSESNTARTIDFLTNPEVFQKPEPEDLDLLLYFAIALVALLFAEWWLQSREQF